MKERRPTAGAKRASRERPRASVRCGRAAAPAAGPAGPRCRSRGPSRTIVPLGPSLAERLETARQEEAAARAEVERLQAAAGANGEPSVERVDAETELERASEEVAGLERRLES